MCKKWKVTGDGWHEIWIKYVRKVIQWKIYRVQNQIGVEYMLGKRLDQKGKKRGEITIGKIKVNLLVGE